MDRAAEVMSRLNKDGGRSTGDVFKACNAGAHGDFDGEPDPVRARRGEGRAVAGENDVKG